MLYCNTCRDYTSTFARVVSATVRIAVNDMGEEIGERPVIVKTHRDSDYMCYQCDGFDVEDHPWMDGRW